MNARICKAPVRSPSTPAALCLWLRGDERGELIARTRELSALLAPALQLDHVVDTFVHQRGQGKHGRDLTGYEDGTENPRTMTPLPAP